MAGQGTVGLELAEQAARIGGRLDAALVCCGGGGLVAGCAVALTHQVPGIAVHAVEPEGFDDTARSLAAGQRLRNAADARSFCDALLAPMPGELTFAVNARLLAGGLVVTDAEVAAAMRLAFRHLQAGGRARRCRGAGRGAGRQAADARPHHRRRRLRRQCRCGAVRRRARPRGLTLSAVQAAGSAGPSRRMAGIRASPPAWSTPADKAALAALAEAISTRRLRMPTARAVATSAAMPAGAERSSPSGPTAASDRPRTPLLARCSIRGGPGGSRTTMRGAERPDIGHQLAHARLGQALRQAQYLEDQPAGGTQRQPAAKLRERLAPAHRGERAVMHRHEQPGPPSPAHRNEQCRRLPQAPAVELGRQLVVLSRHARKRRPVGAMGQMIGGHEAFAQVQQRLKSGLEPVYVGRVRARSRVPGLIGRGREPRLQLRQCVDAGQPGIEVEGPSAHMDAGTTRDGAAQARGRFRRQQLAMPGVLAAVGPRPAAGRAGPRRPERRARRAPAHAPGSRARRSARGCAAPANAAPGSGATAPDRRAARCPRHRPGTPARQRARRAASAGPSAGSSSATGRAGTVPGSPSGRSGMQPAFDSSAKPTLALGMAASYASAGYQEVNAGRLYSARPT